MVDAHTHFLFPRRVSYPWLRAPELEPLRREFTPAELAPELARAGVSRTVLVQTRSSLSETREFLEIAAATPWVAGVVGWADLSDPALGEVLDELRAGSNGEWLVGLRHQLPQEPDAAWLLRPEVARGLRALGERGLSYDLLLEARNRPAALQAARAHPELSFVIDHAANPDLLGEGLDGWKRSLARFAELDHVSVKLSGLVTRADWRSWTPEELLPYFQVCLELFGLRRCLYGSDWPVCLLAAGYGQTLDLLERALEGASAADRAQVLGGAAARVYRLGELDARQGVGDFKG
ncbi:amidohydrolase family protein [Deinococcus sp.]|uniref:amidohydrolase family protein n=1 Tax=Deinococcus sp. TaxID=47478 RepID=UPI003CC6ACE7